MPRFFTNNLRSQVHTFLTELELWPGFEDSSIRAAGFEQSIFGLTAERFDKDQMPRSYYLERKKKHLSDFLIGSGSYVLVSQEFRELVEDVSKDNLNFIEVPAYQSKGGPLLDKRYFFSNFLDKVDAIVKDQCEHVNFHTPRANLPCIKLNFLPTDPLSVIALEKSEIQDRSLWVDKYKPNPNGVYFSDELYENIKAAGIRGLKEAATCVEVEK
jgi:hypothetical protein